MEQYVERWTLDVLGDSVSDRQEEQEGVARGFFLDKHRRTYLPHFELYSSDFDGGIELAMDLDAIPIHAR